jgi:hypothetical protein
LQVTGNGDFAPVDLHASSNLRTTSISVPPTT